jgi:hypothetical protein
MMTTEPEFHNCHPGKNGRCVTCGAQFVMCGQESGSHCSICHHHFADGDDICSGAGHQIGQWYLLSAGVPR